MPNLANIAAPDASGEISLPRDRTWPSLITPCSEGEAARALDELEASLRTAFPPRRKIQLMRDCVRAIGDEALILERLGPDLVRRFFSPLEGQETSRPYFFPAGMASEHMGVYLDFEINHLDEDYQRECVIEVLRQPLLEGRPAAEGRRDFELGCNLAISHLRANHLSCARIIDALSDAEMQRFRCCVDQFAAERVCRVLAHILDHERVKVVERCARAHQMRWCRSESKALKRLRRLDARFFHQL